MNGQKAQMSSDFVTNALHDAWRSSLDLEPNEDQHGSWSMGIELQTNLTDSTEELCILLFGHEGGRVTAAHKQHFGEEVVPLLFPVVGYDRLTVSKTVIPKGFGLINGGSHGMLKYIITIELDGVVVGSANIVMYQLVQHEWRIRPGRANADHEPLYTEDERFVGKKSVELVRDMCSFSIDALESLQTQEHCSGFRVEVKINKDRKDAANPEALAELLNSHRLLNALVSHENSPVTVQHIAVKAFLHNALVNCLKFQVSGLASINPFWDRVGAGETAADVAHSLSRRKLNKPLDLYNCARLVFTMQSLGVASVRNAPLADLRLNPRDPLCQPAGVGILPREHPNGALDSVKTSASWTKDDVWVRPWCTHSPDDIAHIASLLKWNGQVYSSQGAHQFAASSPIEAAQRAINRSSQESRQQPSVLSAFSPETFQQLAWALHTSIQDKFNTMIRVRLVLAGKKRRSEASAAIDELPPHNRLIAIGLLMNYARQQRDADLLELPELADDDSPIFLMFCVGNPRENIIEDGGKLRHDQLLRVGRSGQDEYVARTRFAVPRGVIKNSGLPGKATDGSTSLQRARDTRRSKRGRK